ncbi:MAG: polysaccharide deacetylase family protein [Bradyrhizobium sp.]
MIGELGVRTRPWAALCVGLLGCIATQTASAADCPGHPDAIGTSRTLVVDPRQHPRIGTMQYPETLPLRDHEVVLSFDDGPLPRNSNQILDILASQCVKANFFVIGQMARAYPEGVRKLRDAGHTIGTHSQDHPLTMNTMPIERAKQQVDDGIASVKAALGDDAAALGPFFRIPGLLRAEAVEDYLASLGIQIWSADFPADDWRHISASRVYDLAMERIEAKGRGILLLHDIQARTVAALPRILHELKARGYHIVHVVAATPDRPATPTEPQEWLLHPPSETVAIAHWPRIPEFVFASAGALPAPARSDFDGRDGQLVPRSEPFDRASPHGLDGASPWNTSPPGLAGNIAAATLPVPASSVFAIPEKSYALLLPAAPARPAEHMLQVGRKKAARLVSIEAAGSRAKVRGKRPMHARRWAAAHATAGKTRGTAHARRGPLKHLVLVKRKPA